MQTTNIHNPQGQQRNLTDLKRKKPVKMIDKVKRGLGAMIMSMIPGLITLAVESLISWIKGKQNQQIDNAVMAMRWSD